MTNPTSYFYVASNRFMSGWHVYKHIPNPRCRDIEYGGPYESKDEAETNLEKIQCND